jgi:hypothetical protein
MNCWKLKKARIVKIGALGNRECNVVIMRAAGFWIGSLAALMGHKKIDRPNGYARPDHGRHVFDEQCRAGYGLDDRYGNYVSLGGGKVNNLNWYL